MTWQNLKSSPVLSHQIVLGHPRKRLGLGHEKWSLKNLLELLPVIPSKQTLGSHQDWQ